MPSGVELHKTLADAVSESASQGAGFHHLFFEMPRPGEPRFGSAPCSDVVVPTSFLRSAIQKAYRNCMLSERVLAAGNFALGPHWQSRLLAGASSHDAEQDAPDQSTVHLILSNEGVGRL